MMAAEITAKPNNGNGKTAARTSFRSFIVRWMKLLLPFIVIALLAALMLSFLRDDVVRECAFHSGRVIGLVAAGFVGPHA
jgi:hypothetical protein